MSELELHDIQGMVLSGYGNLPYSRFLFLDIEDPAAARLWIGETLPGLSDGAAGPPTGGTRLHLAFTYPGLRKMGLPWQALKGFSREFEEGMWDNERRRRVLGDVAGDDPARWVWGGPDNATVSILLLLYAESAAVADELESTQRARFAAGGLREVQRLEGSPLPGQKEHFGFRDGISQPKLAGLTSSQDTAQVMAPGEFVLGYPNEHGQMTARPLIDPIQDLQGLLADDVGGSDQRDFGRNGSYMVFRQLAQDVGGFWRFVDEASRTREGLADPAARVALAAKMVGRWPGGAPLVECPANDDPERAEANEFRYHAQDRDGLRCPLGSHIRRTNPRDALAPKPGTEASVAINKRHRILRRGRTYGPPLAQSMAPEDFLVEPAAGAERGLHFICLNANISRQFEFIQHTWVNNPHFAGLDSDTDPLIGDRSRGSRFTLAATPVRKRIKDLPRFVTLRGGAYFFVPGMRALRYLAAQPRPLANAYSAPATDASPLPVSTGLKLARRISQALETGITFTRRFTRVRGVFDRLFRARIEAAAQYLIRRRLRETTLGIAEEKELPDEARVTQQITERMTAFLFHHYRDRTAERAGNTKTYGLLRARFAVAPDLEESLHCGVFQPGKTYPAWVRLAGPGPLVTADIRSNGVLSIGVKLMGVEGERPFEDERHTQDFTGISAPTFTTPNVIENLKLQQHIGRGTNVFYFLNPFDSHLLDAVMQGIYAKAHGCPLEARFWSCVPYLYGAGRAIKYTFVPRDMRVTPVPRQPSFDYLREAMTATLARDEWVFDFRIQFQTDPRTMPLEDASVIWPETQSPYVTVASLHIPAQDFASAGQLAFARNLSFNPWNCVADHRPLGNQNRARRRIYEETSRVRQMINGDERIEPTGEEFT